MIDYNTDYGRDKSVFNGTQPWRYSDHDPIVMKMNLSDPRPTTSPTIKPSTKPTNPPVATTTFSPSVKKAPTAIPSVKVTTNPVAKVTSQPTVKPVVKTTSSPVAKAICNDNPMATYTLVSGATKLCSQLASKSLKRRTNVCSGLVSNAASICPVCLCGISYLTTETFALNLTASSFSGYLCWILR
jgi:hypothetical protein